MTYRVGLYISLAFVTGISFVGSLVLDVDGFVKTVAAMPFVGALFAALFQLLRDHSSFQKDALLQQREHAFVVAATSHMSSVVFDKHVEFSEAYVSALIEVLGKLFAKGPTEDAVHYVDGLHEVRRKYRLWVSPSMASALDTFERQIIDMGSSYSLGQLRTRKSTDKHLDRAYDIFKERGCPR